MWRFIKELEAVVKCWCVCVQAGGGGEAEVCRRPAAERGRVHGHHLPGLHPDVRSQAERRGPGGGAGHRLCESEHQLLLPLDPANLPSFNLIQLCSEWATSTAREIVQDLFFHLNMYDPLIWTCFALCFFLHFCQIYTELSLCG